VTGSKTKGEAKTAAPDEAWLRIADGEYAVRARVLFGYLAKGASITEARVIETAEGVWTIRVRVTGLKGEYVINKYDSDTPRSYKDVALAIHAIYSDMAYRGAIILSSERDYAAPT
jgi:hypothetical protein